MSLKVQSPGQIVKNGLWGNNQALVALLGLCPLLAVTTTAINALGLGLATMLVLLMTNVIVALVRRWLINEIRIPLFVLVIASSVTTVELLMNAHLHDLYRVLGIFIPLIVTNCAVIGRAEAYASKNSTWRAALDGLSMGLGFAVVLFVLGALREVIGYGTLFRQAETLFGTGSEWLTLIVFEGNGFLLAILPPGAFIGLALLIALKNRIDRLRSLSLAETRSDMVTVKAEHA
jgi:electron transport complex protein RnfE